MHLAFKFNNNFLIIRYQRWRKYRKLSLFLWLDRNNKYKTKSRLIQLRYQTSIIFCSNYLLVEHSIQNIQYKAKLSCWLEFTNWKSLPTSYVNGNFSGYALCVHWMNLLLLFAVPFGIFGCPVIVKNCDQELNFA